jgi:hypothetical protein
MKRILSLYILFGLFPFTGNAQKDSSSYSVDEFKEITTDIIIGYYEQDGHHSAVTGGEGTEKLRATMPTIVVNVPFRNGNEVTLELGADAYTSASSDNININTTSGASSKDTRIYGTASYSKTNKESGWVWGGNTSFSNEYDYFSIGFGASILKMLNNENTQLGLSASVFLDNWDLIYPYELRGQGDLLDTDKRNSYSLSFSYSQVLSRRVQMAVFADVISQRGLLSTPYHRVYFNDYFSGTVPKVEFLPQSKMKYPVGMRLNYFATDWLVTRFYYRYYYDDFDVKGHTFSATLPFKLSDKLTLSPFYRYYQQSATKYFAPKGEHSVWNEFYTSDYDLSHFTSQSIGLELGFKKVDGIISYGNKRKGRWEAIKTRYNYYQRSDGLKAHLISVGLTLKN